MKSGRERIKKINKINIETGLECEYWSVYVLETGVCESECTCNYGITGMNRTGLVVCVCVCVLAEGSVQELAEEKRRVRHTSSYMYLL